jgi:peptidoglycan/xylan/chitin deacetylase (PgdA/CDA1 family)
MPEATRLALKIDVDTYRGSREGVPALLDELERAGVRASFFLSLGPDRSGLAIRRIFFKPGFLGKMLRTNPTRMYGFRTMLYGTLLPAPRIALKLAPILRRVKAAGHEVGLHAWDHVLWQDWLEKLSQAQVRAEIGRGVEAFSEVFGARPLSFAAPAWYTTPPALLSLEEAGFHTISVSRGPHAPFRPRAGGRALSLVEVPTTLPTLDEALGRDGITRENWNERLVSLYRPGAAEVLCIHAETEGLAFRPEFRDLLSRHHDLGIRHVTLEDLADEARRRGPPERELALGRIPGRAGLVTVPV